MLIRTALSLKDWPLLLRVVDSLFELWSSSISEKLEIRPLGQQ